MSKLKTTDIPSHAKHFFINLYCEKNGGKTYENKQVAAQSWLSLSYAKKRHFYDTISTKTAIKRGQRIIQTKPYLREKNPTNARKRRKQQNIELNLDEVISELDKSHHTESDHETNVSLVENTYSDVLEQNENEYLTNVDNPINPFMSVVDAEKTDGEDEINSNVKVTLTEPVLPIAKTGKELFELLRIKNGLNKTYESLTPQEKKMYARAICAIKKDYVKRYKIYLESLTPKQLFDYYMKAMP